MKVRVAKVDSPNICAAEVGPPEQCAAKVYAAKVEATEIRVCQHGAAEVGSRRERSQRSRESGCVRRCQLCSAPVPDRDGHGLLVRRAGDHRPSM